MKFTITKTCRTNLRIPEYGIVLPGEETSIELEFSEPNVNTVKVLDTDTNSVVNVHEVIFKVSVEGQLQNGYYTQVIGGMDDASNDDIIEAAKALILG